jgi:hypothetical protein
MENMEEDEAKEFFGKLKKSEFLLKTCQSVLDEDENYYIFLDPENMRAEIFKDNFEGDRYFFRRIQLK